MKPYIYNTFYTKNRHIKLKIFFLYIIFIVFQRFLQNLSVNSSANLIFY